MDYTPKNLPPFTNEYFILTKYYVKNMPDMVVRHIRNIKPQSFLTEMFALKLLECKNYQTSDQTFFKDAF